MLLREYGGDMTSGATPSLRWGILATGGIARSFTSDLRAAGRDVRAVGSRTADGAERFAAAFDIPRAHPSYEALAADDDVDIVYIATPHPMHAENALRAIAHGKHVLIEKPFTLTGDEAETVARSAAEQGVLALEAMWTRYLPHMRRIREIIADGALGDIRTLSADHTQLLPSDPAHRLNALELGGGALLDLGVYPISFACGVLGLPETVTARGRLGVTGADTEVATVFTHAGGALSTTLSSSRGAGGNTAHIAGTEARIDIDRIWYKPTSFRVTRPDGEIVEEYASHVDGGGLQFSALAAERLVAAGDLTGGELPTTESVAIMRLLDDIRTQIGVHYPEEA